MKQKKSNDMKTRRLGIGLLLLSTFFLVDAQVISSKKSYLKVKKEPTRSTVNQEPAYLDINAESAIQKPEETQKEVTSQADISPPEIKLVSHNLTDHGTIETPDPEAVIVGKVSDQSEISSLMVNAKVAEVSDAGIFSATISLDPGKNDISILALDSHDNLKNFRFSIHYKPIKLSLAETAHSESVFYGLIIGINNYTDPSINSLDRPIEDAQALYDILTEEYTFEPENIQYIPNAKRDDIIYALDNLSRTVTPQDNLLIFYAGHGKFDESSHVGYWLPSDARKISKADWFRNSTLVDYLKEIESKHTLLITDACFGGSIFKTRAAYADTPKAIEILYELPSRKAMTSGNLSEVPDQSSFSKYLTNRLTSNKEQYLSSEQLFSSLRIAVINNSEAVPMYGEIRNVGDQGGDFIFIRK